MSAAGLRVIHWGEQRVRAGPWRGDPRIAYLVPVPGGTSLTVPFLRRCLDQLAREGYSEVLTAALSHTEQTPYLDAGFTVAQRLHLLAHDLRHVQEVATPSGVVLRRGRRSDRPPAVEVDGRAFDEFWRLDAAGLQEAISATASARFRVAVEGDRVVGYCVTGRSARHGYLQRLAVDTTAQGRGVGRALVMDGLGWLRRWRCTRCLVNTQVGNDTALALYRTVGFVAEPTGLAVLGRGTGSG